MPMNKQTRLVSLSAMHKIRYLYPVLFFGISMFLAGCATEPMGPKQIQGTPPPSVEVYFYPTKGQSQEQQDRDRYECALWATSKTGFDPSLPGLAPGQRVQVEPAAPSGQKAAAGAFIGAVVGAATSRPGESREGAVTGAIAGALIGASADAADQEKAAQIQRSEQARIDARLAREADEYRRAMTACLEGRGYTVK